MKSSEKLIEFVKRFEGFKATAYKCSAGKWTCGFGRTRGINKRTKCTEEEATKWLKEDLEVAENAVKRLVKVELKQNQFDALVSFTFNVGQGALSISTLLKKLNSGDVRSAGFELLKWDKVRKNGKLEVSKGLARRRIAELNMFESAIY